MNPRNIFSYAKDAKRKSKRRNRMINLSEVTTKELSEELERRQGVITVQVEPYEKIEVGGIRVAGPAIVLINQD